jgi:phage shock protein PspC (stress-responsive transcriptional regulator)
MKKVVSISLNGIAYQLEEPGYDELRVYLERAEARLKDSPDRAEIMADLEQAVGEKCSRVLGPHKTVVSSAEISGILLEMGPVESADEKPGEAAPDAGFAGSAAASASAPASSGMPPPRKRLFKIREGEMWFGVCNGIAAYLGVDVTWVRIAFVMLALVTTGFVFLAYFALVFIVPYAETSEDRAAAFGAPFSTEEFIGRAKKKPDDHREYQRWRREWRRQQRQWQKQWDQMNAQVRQATSQFGPQMAQTGRGAIFALLVPIAAIMGAALFVAFILCVLSLVAQHDIFGWALPHGLPWWAGIALMAVLYAFGSTIVRAFRHGGGPAVSHPGWSALHGLLWICCALGMFWVAYMFFPGVREIIDQLTWATSLTFDNLSSTIV